MNIELEVPDFILQMQPVIVVAPTARNGITLVQRLLNSSRKIFMYGEDLIFFEEIALATVNIIQGRTCAFRELELSRQHFLAGDSEFWSGNLLPDAKRYVVMAARNFYNYVLLYQQDAREAGFEAWGMKCPLTEIGPDVIQSWLALMPSTRFVFIYRNLFDVVRSAKARKFCVSEQDIAEYAMRWEKNVLFCLRNFQGLGNRMLLIRYEDLVENPPRELVKLENFTGVSGIDPEVMQRKINTFKGDAKHGFSPSGYLAPEELTLREKEIIREYAAAGLSQAGYGNEGHAQALEAAVGGV